MNDVEPELNANKCFRCGGTEIAKGKIQRDSKEYFSDVIFAPNGLRFLALTFTHGVCLAPESYACLDCGSVWSQTNPLELKGFIEKHCKPQKDG